MLRAACPPPLAAGRYTSSWLAAERQRDGEWWEGVLRPLVAKQKKAMGAAAAARVAGEEAAAEAGPSQQGGGAAGAAAQQGRPSAVAQRTQKQQAKARKSAEHMLAAREEAELSKRAHSEKQGLPTTVGEPPLALPPAQPAARKPWPNSKVPCCRWVPHAPHLHPGAPHQQVHGAEARGQEVWAAQAGAAAARQKVVRPSSQRPDRAAPSWARRGEPYFLRSEVEELHSAERWKRQGREVRACALAGAAETWAAETWGAPWSRCRATGTARGAGAARQAREEARRRQGQGARHARRRPRRRGAPLPARRAGLLAPAALRGTDGVCAQEEGEGEEAATIALYGSWQTRPWAPAAAAGGKVPRNERGNVEVPPFAHALPAGTVNAAGHWPTRQRC